jgi:hypothetical protein
MSQMLDERHRKLEAAASVCCTEARLAFPLPASAVVLGSAQVCRSGRIRCGDELLIYPNQYMETQGEAEIVLGDGVVLSTGLTW